MRPESYGQTPNPLDPVFYTGFSINFDDLSAILPDRYYFISRWSVYMPQRLACSLFGPELGRLMWRWALASVLLAAIFSLGKKRGWHVGQELLVGVVVLTMPSFVRAFFTDYVEYLVAALGIVLVSLAFAQIHQGPELAEPHRTKPGHRGPPIVTNLFAAALMGVVSGLIIVANPVGLLSTGLVAGAYASGLMRDVRSSNLSGQAALLRLATIAFGIAAVVGGGWLVFRFVYDQPNLYGSTIEMISTIGRDPLKSPKLEWLGRYTWLYATPILVASYLAIWYRPKHPGRRLDGMEWTAMALASVQYLAQWADQLLRDGPGLELSYYFVYSLPSFALVAVLFVARASRTLSPAKCAAIALGWCCVVWWGFGDSAHLPAGLKFGFLAVVSIVTAFVVANRQPTWSSVGIGVLVLATQIAAPKYDPTSYHLYNTSPKYEALFRRKTDYGQKTLSDAIWLTRELDTVRGDTEASFIPIGGWLSDPNFVAGIYGPQPTARLMYLDANLAPTPQTAFEIDNGSRPIVVVLGPPDLVDTAVEQLRTARPEMYLSASAVHDGGFGFKYVVLTVPHATRMPVTWNGSDLRIQSGNRADDDVVSPVGNASIITFGPYLPLRKGRYLAQLTYSADAPPSQKIGTADAFFTGFGIAATRSLFGTDGKPQTLELPFDVPADGARVEIRPASNGTSEILIRTLRISAAG